jgi:hypothetical protein
MEEVGGHDEVEESAIITSSAEHTDDISDALQEAAQPLVTEAAAAVKEFPVSLTAASTAPSASTVSSSAPVGILSPPTQNLFRPIASTIPPMPNPPIGICGTLYVNRPTWTPPTAVPTFTAGGALPSVPVNLSTPTRPPSYQPVTPGTTAISQVATGSGAAANQTAIGEMAPPPPPTGGFVPAHGVVTATPGKHHSSLPLAPPSSLASHLLTPSAVDQSASTEFSSYSPQQQQQTGLVGSYTPSQVAASPYSQPPSYSQPLPAADYGQAMMQSASYPLGPHGVRVEPAPPSPQRSDRFFGWLPGSGLVHKMIEKTKSSVETVITTLDPGMKEVIYSGGSVNIVVTSSKEVKVGAVREAFQSVFGRATVVGMDSQPSIAPQPVGYSAGVRGAEERIENLRRSGVLDEQQAIVSIENFIVELLPDRWFDVGCVLLKDPRYGIDLMTFTQATPAPAECVCAAQDATPPDYPLHWSGLAMTVGQAVQRRVPHIDHTDWHAYYTGVSRREMLTAAARSLAGMYRTQLP